MNSIHTPAQARRAAGGLAAEAVTAATTAVAPADTNGQSPQLEEMHRITDAMALLKLSRSKIYELVRSGRLGSVKEGRRRMIPSTAIAEYIALLKREAAGETTPTAASTGRTS